jgi:hypothetical protein
MNKPYKTITTYIVMTDYKNGKIYRLVCNTTGKQYIGSTTQSLSQRLGGHKAVYKHFIDGKTIYQVSSFSILCENNFEMILIEEFPCENKNQLERRERYYIEITKCVNKIKPAQTKEEQKKHVQKYIQEHKEHKEKYYQKYHQEHKEQKQMYHYENQEKRKENRQKNKEKLTALTNCECGGQYQHRDKAKHFKTLKHKNWLATHETI